MAANRIGKSFSEAMEFSFHLTGRYPDWWKGHRVLTGGRTYWCVGVDLDSVANVLQKELFGTSDCRVSELLGTGAIPREHIITDKGWQPDGGRLRSCLIAHVSGEPNTLKFYGSQNESNMMGQTVSGVWIDELDKHNASRIYAQCSTRTATIDDGFIVQTATPEHGMQEIIKTFMDDKTGYLYLQTATWDDAPHLSDEVKASLLASYPAWQHDMRSKGIPVIGEGAVFDIADADIKSDPVNPLPHHWWIAHGVDFGMVNDPSVVATVAYDPDNDCAHLVGVAYLGDKKDPDNQDRSPEAIARAILDGPYPHAPVIVPHDAGLNSAAPETKGKQLIDLGVNVHHRSFSNPVDAQLEIDQNTYKKHDTTANSVEAGLSLMRSAFKHGKLKVFSNMGRFFDEKHGYYYQMKPTGYKPHGTAGDHVIDAFRYCYVGGILNNNHCSVAEATGHYVPSPYINMGIGF